MTGVILTWGVAGTSRKVRNWGFLWRCSRYAGWRVAAGPAGIQPPQVAISAPTASLCHPDQNFAKASAASGCFAPRGMIMKFPFTQLAFARPNGGYGIGVT